MQTVLKLKANELTPDFLELIRGFVKNKNSVITVKIDTIQDETDYLLSSAKNRKALEKSLKTTEGYVFSLDEFKQLNKDLRNGKKPDVAKLKKEKLAS